jgi:5-methylcytosine-specific restriction endonuclease McrA
MKTCCKCGESKGFECYNKDKKSKDGLSYQCRECSKEAMRIWREQNKGRDKEYREENKDKISERHKKYREINKEKLRKKSREWHYENIEKVAKRKKEWRNKNKVHISQYYKEYQINNRDKVNVKTQRYRANKRTLPNELTHEQWVGIKNHFSNKCAYCGKEEMLEQEHFIPSSNGGEFTKNNIVPACRRCNASKNSKSFFEWYPNTEYYSKQREKEILKYLNYKTKNVQQLALL